MGGADLKTRTPHNFVGKKKDLKSKAVKMPGLLHVVTSKSNRFAKRLNVYKFRPLLFK